MLSDNFCWLHFSLYKGKLSSFFLSFDFSGWKLDILTSIMWQLWKSRFPPLSWLLFLLIYWSSSKFWSFSLSDGGWLLVLYLVSWLDQFSRMCLPYSVSLLRSLCCSLKKKKIICTCLLSCFSGPADLNGSKFVLNTYIRLLPFSEGIYVWSGA